MGLLDDTGSFLKTPAGMGLLSAVASGMAGYRRNAPLNSIGQGLLGGLQGYNQAQEQDQKQAFQKIQMDDFKAQAGLRDAQLKQLQRQQAYLEKLMGGGAPDFGAGQSALSQGAQAGDIGPTMTNAARMPMSQQGGGGNYGISSDAMAADMALNGGKNIATWLYERSKPDIQVANGYAYDKNAIKPGFLPGVNISQNGQAALTTIDPDGMPVISLPKGAAVTQAGNVVAQELPKAIINSGFKREDFVNPDGTTRSITGLQFGKESGGLGDMMNYLGHLDGSQPQGPQGMPQGAPAPQAPIRAANPASLPQRKPSGAVNPGQMVISPQQQAALDGNRAAILTDEWNKNPQDRPSIEAEMKRIGVRPPSGQSGVVSGVPTSVKTNNDAATTYATGVAKDIVDTRKTIMDAGMNARGKIDTLNMVGQLLEGTNGGNLSGLGVKAASALNSLGIKTDSKLGDKEAATALSNGLALRARNAPGANMPGSMSDPDREFLVNMTPSMAQSADGRKKLIAANIAIEQRNQQVSEMARKYEDKYGRLDNNFFSQLQSWSNAHPMFKR